MGRNDIELPSEFKRRINKTVKHIKEEASLQVAKDIKHMYNSAIKDFYADYRPRSYNRTFSAFIADNLRGTDDYSKIIEQHDDGFTVAFSVGDGFISGNPYRAKKDWVFNRTFVEGIHGWTPDEVMNIPNHFLGGYGYDPDRHDEYFVNMLQRWTNVPKPLSPPPKAKLDELYKKYKLPTRLRKKIKPIVDRNIEKYLKG